MKIGEKEYSEIIVTDAENNLLVSITDEDIITEKSCKVECVPVVDNQDEKRGEMTWEE